AVLEALLNKDIVTRSAALAEELNESIRTYVPNQSFSRALEILTNTHVCVIAGLPGIGKTTLARVLAAQHLATGYELIEVSEDVDEVNRLWNPDKPQLFYYDDFLGQTDHPSRQTK
ncbi:hypothetical protein, partial [Actinophytocola sp.]|uniref:nSTAND3 domain-containing NTPase n=1 Tax=Actinophytocola sp. TaxID=1872138 RepID=UPI00389A1083